MKNIIKNIAVLTALLSSFAAVSAQDLALNISPTTNGAWVEVSQYGAPVSGVVINDNTVTDENGRAFVYASKPNSSVLKLDILTPEGESIAKNIFIGQNS